MCLAVSAAEEWKLEECGAYGTCVCVKQMAELGRVYKLEMVLNISPETLHSELTNYDNLIKWDNTLDSVSLLHSFGESTRVLRIVSNQIDGRKSIAKREFIVAIRTCLVEGNFYCFGSSIDYSSELETSVLTDKAEAEDSSNTNEALTRGDYKIFGYIIKTIENDPNKCEFVRYVSTDIKSWIAQFRIDKAITQLLLNFAECLQSRVKELNTCSVSETAEVLTLPSHGQHPQSSA